MGDVARLQPGDQGLALERPRVSFHAAVCAFRHHLEPMRTRCGSSFGVELRAVPPFARMAFYCEHVHQAHLPESAEDLAPSTSIFTTIKSENEKKRAIHDAPSII